MIRIIGDTTSGLTLAQAQEMGIEFIPQIIVFGDKSYRDDIEIDSATFVKKLKESTELPKTAAPPPALYTTIYEDMMKKGDSAVIICPSTILSGTVRSAVTAKYDFPELDVRIIDSLSIGSGIAMMLKNAKQWVDEGKTIDEVESLVRDMARKEHIYAVVDTLEYLHKGGRIGGASKLMGDILQIKPILVVKNGRVEVFEKQRTYKKALSRLIEIVESQCNDPQQAYFSFGMLETGERLEFLQDEFSKKFNASKIPYYNLPPGIMVHAGPGLIMVSFFSD